MNTAVPRWKIWLAAFALFASGAAVGVVVTFGIGVRLVRQRLLAPPAAYGFADRATARMETHLTKELGLTPDQTVKVHAIMEDTSLQMKGIRFDAVRDIRRTLRRALAEIRPQLTADQAAQLDQLVAGRLDRLGLTADPTAP